MARCPYCGTTISNGSLPCPYCEGGTSGARRGPRRICARCGQDVTVVQDAWCPGCGFRIRSVEAPPAPPTITVPAGAGGAGRALVLLFMVVVGALVIAQVVPPIISSWGADP